jgi:hemolysin type calcium-binding protein
MKRVWLAGIAMGALGAGCTTQTDNGVVMGCFGLVNQNVPGQDVFSSQVVTNLYFGGCSPADNLGMQILERVTPEAAADGDLLNSFCDRDCEGRLTAYAAAHPGVPRAALSCQTLFASPCSSNVQADVSNLSGDTGAFQGGGPADQRFLLTGNVTLTIGNQTVPISASGLVDATMGPCQGAGMNCPVTVSRLDVTANQSFVVNGITFGSAEIQNQGIGTGMGQAGNTFLDPMELEVDAFRDDTQTTTSFHVTSQTLNKSSSQPLTLTQFFSSFSLASSPVTQNGVTVQVTITMTGQPFGVPPVASMTSSSPTTNAFECTCAACTSVSFFSTATDPDNDLQSLAWLEDNALMPADGTAAPPELDLSVPMNFTNLFDPRTNTHTVELVATDTRGATSTSTQTFKVQDTTPPVITAPPNITLRSCDFPYIGQATASDVCDANVVITSNQTAFQTGTSVVTWSAEDSSGNVATATQIVTVQQVDPKVCCPAGLPVLDGRTMHQGADGKTHVTGTSASECLIGTSNNDVIIGNGGNDVVFGIGGQDQITTGAGADLIIAGTGTNDTITTGDGNDRIASGAANNTIVAGNGNDIIVGSPNIDTITVGNGNNIIYALAGGDTIKAGNGTNYIDGGPDDDHITCGGGNNTIVGGPGNDAITVGGGTDVLAAWQGDDHLNGGTGTDTFLGGPGHTVCTSGGGTNTFVDCNK